MRSSFVRGSFAFVFGMITVGTGCASMGFGTDTPKLVGTASFDHNCPKDKIQVVSEEPGSTGVTLYVLDVCGTKKKYKRAGTLYYDAEKGSPMVPQ